MKPEKARFDLYVPELEGVSQVVKQIFKRAYVDVYYHHDIETFGSAWKRNDDRPLCTDVAFHSRNSQLVFTKNLSLKSRKVGEIHFKQYCNGTVSHEVFHLVETMREIIYIVTRKGKLPEKKFTYRARHITRPEEEALAYAMGYLSYNIYFWLYNLKKENHDNPGP